MADLVLAREQVPIARIAAAGLRPQALIARGPDFFAQRRGIRFEDGHDGLDHYQAAALRLSWRLPGTQRSDAGIFFALLRYRGMPADAVNLLLPETLVSEAEITAATGDVLRALDLEEADLAWRRAQTPEA